MSTIRLAEEFDSISEALGLVDEQCEAGDIFNKEHGRFQIVVRTGNGQSLNVIPAVSGNFNEDNAIVVTTDGDDAYFVEFLADVLRWFGGDSVSALEAAMYFKAIWLLSITETNAVPTFRGFDSTTGLSQYEVYQMGQGHVRVHYDVLFDEIVIK